MLVLVPGVFGNASGEVKHTVFMVCELRIVTYSFRCASALPACKALKRVWKVHVPVRKLERVKGLDLLSGSNTLPCASITASFATSQEVSLRIFDLLCDLLLFIPVAATRSVKHTPGGDWW